MIEYDLITYLLTDATLKTLLGWSSSDPKIYPIQAPENSTPPYILYSCQDGPKDEVIKDDRVQLSGVSDDLEEATDIRERLIYLLDRKSRIQNTAFYSISSDYYIYSSENTGYNNMIDTETKLFYAVNYYNVKYQAKIFV